MIPESPIIPEREIEFARDAEKVISEYSSDVADGKMKLVELIEKLGHYIVDPDEFKRYQGTYILVEVLNRLPPKLLQYNETDKLITFFCDRVKDHFMILPVVLKGFNALMVMENINTEIPMSVLGKLADDVVCQSLSHSNRYNYYNLYKIILHHHKDAIAEKGMEFVRYLVNTMDGESDPRNLMLLFRFIPNVLRIFTLNETLTEELFSVLECYFPVDFTPSSRFMITREDLKEGLEDCLTATPLFFPHCLPLILEKLDSKLKTAHLDSLHLLIRECRMWGAETLKDQLNALWTSIKELVFSGGDSEVANLAIQAFSVVISSSANSPNMKEQLDQCLESVSSTRDLLMDASLNLFPRVMKLQGALALSSPVPAENFIIQLLPHLLNVLEFEKEHKDVVISSLLPIFEASVNFDLWNCGKPEIESNLSKVPDILFKYIEIQRLRSYCTKGFTILLRNLNQEQRNKLYTFLKNSKAGDNDISQNEATLVKEISKLYPEEIVSEFLENMSSDDSLEIHSRNVEILSWSCQVPSVTKFCCNKFISLLELNKFIDVTVNLLRISCENIGNEEVLQFMGGKECLMIDKILSLYCNDKLICDNKTHLCVDLAKIFQRIVSSMNQSDQFELVSRCIDNYFTKFTLQNQPLEVLSPLIILLEGVLGALHQDVDIPSLESILNSLTFISLTCEDEVCRVSSSRLIASVFNKQLNDKLLNNIILVINNQLESNKTSKKGKHAVYLASWICKALVLCNHPSHLSLIDKLISMLSCKELCMEAAEGFKIILTESEYFLNRSCHAKIGILYKQRVFENILKLMELQDGVEGACSCAVNLTIAYLLKFSPPQLVINRLKELIKIIVRCLESEDVNVSHSTLEVIASLLATKNVIFEDYTSVLIPRCLNLSASGPMDVRISALECLSLYSEFKELIILPFRNQVIIGLAKSLDDKKRLVRKRAVEARSKWFLLGAV